MQRGDRRVLLVAGGLTLAIGLLDYLTPAEADFTEFYMLAVVVTAWVLGWKAGVAFAFIGVATALVADDALRSTLPAVTLWNALSDLGVLLALAVITDRLHLARVANKAAHDHERARWESVDAKRNTLQTLLVREFPRPLRALEWFSRTFEEPLLRNSTEAMRTQFRALRHHIQEVTFLGTDLLQLGVMDTGGVRFERRRINLAEVLTEAADGSSARARVLLSLTNQPITVVADADRLRQAFACLIDRSLELSPHDDVTVLTRVSADEAAVEVSSRARELEDADVELSRLLVVGNGGRLVLISRGAMRGSLATVHLPLDQNPRNSSAEEVAAQGRVAE
jgi:hypothetical protein